MKKLLFTALLLATSILQSSISLAGSTPLANPTLITQEPQPTPQEIQQKVRQIAKNITVRITSENNGGSGVIIAQKGDTDPILTSVHVFVKPTNLSPSPCQSRSEGDRVVLSIGSLYNRIWYYSNYQDRSQFNIVDTVCL